MEIKDYIAAQSPERRNILTEIHQAILDNDKTVDPIVEPMMGKEMIIYKARGMMKYGLASVKKYMSLHVLPIYMNTKLYSKYERLLPEATFQKGCINFNREQEMPLTSVRQLVIECAAIDLVKIREDYLQKKKAGSHKQNKRI